MNFFNHIANEVSFVTFCSLPFCTQVCDQSMDEHK